MPLDTGQMLWLYRRGWSLKEIATKCGISKHQVHRRITKLRYEQGEVIITKKDLQECLDKGMTRRQIAEKYLCCESIISKKAKQHGLKMRPRGCATFIEKSQS